MAGRQRLERAGEGRGQNECAQADEVDVGRPRPEWRGERREFNMHEMRNKDVSTQVDEVDVVGRVQCEEVGEERRMCARRATKMPAHGWMMSPWVVKETATPRRCGVLECSL